MRTCPTCAQAVADNAFSCPNCGSVFAGAATPAPFAAAAPAAAPAYVPPRSSGKATASMVLGIFGMLLSVVLIGIPLGILAVIFGHLSLAEIKKAAGRMTGEGKAIAGLVMGYLSVCMLVMLPIIAAIAIPNLIKSRLAANEASAVGSVRTIITQSITYQAQCSKFPDSITQLGSSPQNDCEHGLGYLDPVLVQGERSGYRFVYTKLPDEHFSITASPLNPGNTGIRYFYGDDTGVIRTSSGGPADADSAPLE